MVVESNLFLIDEPKIIIGFFALLSFLQNECFPSTIDSKVSTELPKDSFC